MLPQDALVPAFIDPWTYEITFDGLASLVQGRTVDLIVTFHSTAMKRNAHQDIQAVDRFLGDSDWKTRYWQASGDVSNPPTTVLIDTFRSRLSSQLSYAFFGEPQVIRNNHGAPIFYLLFASGNRRGLDFWEKSASRTRSGQRSMF